MMKQDKILIGHGSGGRMTSDLIRDYFVKNFDNHDFLTDSAIVEAGENLLAFTTDSYVIDPVFFPGGNIGKLAICGTINDLAVSGAVPLYISAAFIIEEGFDLNDLRRISQSMSQEAEKAHVKIVAGDTKVVKKGQCDKIFINTSGIGILKRDFKSISKGENIKPGDLLLINGDIGDHATAILGAREKLHFEHEILSDCASLNRLISEVLDSGISVKFMRDITRGGLATILSELCENRAFGINITEDSIPVKEVVKGTCEIFGFDPLYLANEGKVLFVIDKSDAKRALSVMKKIESGKNSAIIGEISGDHAGKPILRSIVGGTRILDKLSGELLPRIC